jgi:hypothetical protein
MALDDFIFKSAVARESEVVAAERKLATAAMTAAREVTIPRTAAAARCGRWVAIQRH